MTRGRLEIRGVAHDFAGAPVLNGIDLAIAPGEVVALLGPSGCGKSTLLGVVAGLLVPRQGRVLLDGRDITGRPGEVALMPQRDLLFPWRTVAGNVALGLEVQGVRRAAARERARAALARVGLGDVANADPRTLSGGMRQRAAFARTMVQGRALMLLDEPFGALDAITRADLHGWVADVWAEERASVLLVTHDAAEAARLADRVVLMSPCPGRVAEIVEIDLPRPRTAAMLLDDAFAAEERVLRRAVDRFCRALPGSAPTPTPTPTSGAQ